MIEGGACQWCGEHYQPGDGRKWRTNGGTGRYKTRPARFCGQKCYYRFWQVETGRLSEEQTALRLLQLRHRDEFQQLLAEERERRLDRESA